MSGALSVYLAREDHEKQPVHELVRTVYAQAYGTVPAPVPLYACVRRGGTLVACMGYDYAGTDGLFAIERIYKLDRSTYPLPVTAGNTVQLGRLVSVEAGMGMLAAHAAFRFARELGWLYALVDHEEGVHKLTTRYGFSFRDVTYNGVDLSVVAPEDHAYFSKGLGRPHLVHVEESIVLSARRLTAEMKDAFPT